MKIEKPLTHYYQYAFPMQTVLVTCNDIHGNTNIITLAWHTPLTKKPPLYGISISPKRYSHTCISHSKEFVINFIPYSLAEHANYCGTHSGRNKDKSNEAQLTFIPSKKIKTPSIAEAYAHLECTLNKIVPLGDHDLFLGEVIAIIADDAAFPHDLLQIEQKQPLYYIGENTYTTLNPKEKREF